MTVFDPAAARARCNAATPGPWHRVTPHSGFLQCPKCEQAEYVAKSIRSVYGPAHHDDSADAEFIAAAREDLPAALDVIVVLRDEIDGIRAERDAARAEVAALRAALDRAKSKRDEWRRCAEYAMHLAMYGERAPGGDETWDQFERMIRAAATVSDPADDSHCPHCARPLPHNETEQAACGRQR